MAAQESSAGAHRFGRCGGTAAGASCKSTSGTGQFPATASGLGRDCTLDNPCKSPDCSPDRAPSPFSANGAHEAEVVKGVEDTGDADEGEVHTHEVPQDDVLGEYLDKNQ